MWRALRKIANLLQFDEFDVAQANSARPAPKNKEEIHATFDQSVRAVEDYLNTVTENAAMRNWRLVANGRLVFTKPRVAVMRTIMMNHYYHHRGQLSVFLRPLDVPVPVIYGRSADENPFA